MADADSTFDTPGSGYTRRISLLLDGLSETLAASREALSADYTLGLEKLAEMVADAGHSGLHDVCLYLHEAISPVVGQRIGDDEHARLEDWPRRVRAYLATPTDRRIVSDVLNILEQPLFVDAAGGDAVGRENVEVLRAMLTEPGEDDPQAYAGDDELDYEALRDDSPEERSFLDELQGSVPPTGTFEQGTHLLGELETDTLSGDTVVLSDSLTNFSLDTQDGISTVVLNRDRELDEPEHEFGSTTFGDPPDARTTATGEFTVVQDLGAARDTARLLSADTGRLEFTLDGATTVDFDGAVLPAEVTRMREVESANFEDPAVVEASMAHVESCLDSFAVRAVELEELALHDVVMLTRDILSQAASSSHERAGAALRAFADWPDLLENYLRHSSVRTWEALVGWLANPEHGGALSREEVEMLMQMFEAGTESGTDIDLVIPQLDLASEDDRPFGDGGDGLDTVRFEPAPGNDPQDNLQDALEDAVHSREGADTGAQDVQGTALPDTEPFGTQETGKSSGTELPDAQETDTFDHSAPFRLDLGETVALESAGLQLDADAQADERPESQEVALPESKVALPEPMGESTGVPVSGPIDELVDEPANEPANDVIDGPVSALSSQALELMDLLSGEFAQLSAELAEGAESEPADAVRRFDEALERFGGACDAAGLPGLALVCAHLRANVPMGDESDVALASRLCGANERVLAYLQDPTDAQHARSLVDTLSDDAWAQPLPAEEAGAMLASLGSPQLDEGMEDLPVRPETATDEDASLAIPEDVNPDLLEGLLQELPLQAEAFSSAIQNLIAGGGDQGITHDIDVAQRVAHTLKGAGNTVGVPGIANVTHHLEDVLLGLRKIEAKPSRALGEMLMTAADCIEGMSEYLTGSGGYPDDIKSVLQGALDWANLTDREGAQVLAADEASASLPSPAPSEPASPPDLSRPTPQSLRRRASDPLAQEEAGEEADSAAPRGVGLSGVSRDDGDAAVQAMVRVPAALVDNLLRLVGETIILTGQVHERLRSTREQTGALITQFDLLRQLGGELETHIDLADISGSARRAQVAETKFGAHAPAASGGDSPAFDPLEMDEYNELHTVSRRLVEAATDARELGQSGLRQLVDLEDMLVTQGRLNRETQEAVLRTRMVPVKNVLPRLQRAVRQTCRLTGKQVEADFVGGETLMDSDVLNNIVDPLMHLLRNAIDHGIESPDAREAAGKSRAGAVRLEFSRDGNQVIVRCVDDGGGIDFERIRAKAESLGLIGDGVNVTEQELRRLLFRPNFSTRDEVTHVSGRGVGLDAVYSRVVELGGSIEVHSELGQSCTIDVRLPVTLISTHALLVRAGDQTIALANRGVEQILHPDSGELKRVGDELMFRLEADAHPARTLESVLGLERPDAAAIDRRPVVLVRGEAGLSAVLPEAVVGSRDLVVKGLGQYIPKLRGIIGATILGDGSVTPVLDLPELLRTPARSSVRATGGLSGASDRRAGVPAPAGARSVLVVDDSLSARRSLAQAMKDYGYIVRTARDGLEAVTELEQSRPDLLLTDLEMPRMNGMELARHARARKSTLDLPIIMVTSRSTQKHREEAEAAGVNIYLTKPFSEEELIDHAESLLSDEPRRAHG